MEEEPYYVEEDWTTENLQKMAECAQEGKVLSLQTGECVPAWPPQGYTPPPIDDDDDDNGGGAGVPPGLPKTLPGYIATTEHERVVSAEKKSARNWMIGAIVGTVTALAIGGGIGYAMRRR